MNRVSARPIIYVLVVGGIIILALVLFGVLSEEEASGSPAPASTTLVQGDDSATRAVTVDFKPVRQSDPSVTVTRSNEQRLLLNGAIARERDLSTSRG